MKYGGEVFWFGSFRYDVWLLFIILFSWDEMFLSVLSKSNGEFKESLSLVI